MRPYQNDIQLPWYGAVYYMSIHTLLSQYALQMLINSESFVTRIQFYSFISFKHMQAPHLLSVIM